MNIFNVLLSLFLAMPLSAGPAKYVKFATVAPEGSTWMKVMGELNSELEKKTQGGLKFKIYAGGVSGDEKDVVKKIRAGQLHAGGFTGVGLGEIAPEVRILDSPWLFKSFEEVDFIYEEFDKELSSAVVKGGYVLLGWVEIGPVHIFSKNPIRDPEDMKKARMWVWEGDPIAEAAYKAVGVTPIPLSVIDVLSMLQTGRIDAVYGPPMGILALQWFTRTKHVYPVPMAVAAGAVLVSKKSFDGISPDQQKILLEVCSAHLKRLNALSRKENEQALKTLTSKGLKMSPQPSEEVMRLYEDLGKRARRELAGRLYSEEFLDRVEKALEKFRNGKAKKG